MRLTRRLLSTCALAVVFAIPPANASPAPALAAPPATYALDSARARIDNFGQVNEQYYRGAQPVGGDYAALAAMGIRTVIDLQADGDNADEAQLVAAAGMRFYRIPMTQHAPPTPAQIAQFLEIVNDAEHQPVYVHCRGGRHRTGVMTAVYRMQHDGWSADQAFHEMKRYRFGLDLLHLEFKRFVYRYTPVRSAPLAAAQAGGE